MAQGYRTDGKVFVAPAVDKRERRGDYTPSIDLNLHSNAVVVVYKDSALVIQNNQRTWVYIRRFGGDTLLRCDSWPQGRWHMVPGNQEVLADQVLAAISVIA